MSISRYFGRTFLAAAKSETSAAAAAATSTARTGYNPLEEFFEVDRSAEDDKPVVYGRSWKAFELRLKSWDDLNKLWYILFKEKNMLMSQRQMFNAQNLRFPNPERIPKDENQNAQNPEGVIVLGVYMHCQGCADTIVNHLRGFDGVEEIETDMKTHRVSVKGKNADPRKVVDRLRKKTEKHIHLISPILKVEEKKEQKKEEPKIFQVVLKILMHCEGCAEDIKYRIHKMQEVHTVETDMKNAQVTVKGTFEPKKLVEYIHKKAGKHAVIVKQTPPEEKEDEKEKEKDCEIFNPCEYYQIHPPGLVYAPQLFSDENPNACSVM